MRKHPESYRGPVLFETRCLLLDDVVLVEAHFTIAFLPSDAMRKHGLCCRPVSVRPLVCLSVCLSVTSVNSIQTAKVIVKLFSRPGSPIILVFDPTRRYPIPRETSSAGTQNRKGVGKFLRFSTESPYITGNGTR